MFSSVAVCVPTYNSGKTIIKLIYTILKQAPDATVFLIDDNSPDQTAKIVAQKFAKNQRVIILMRKAKGGRGSAVLYGFSQALKHKKFKYFVEMDSDLVHDPKFIPKLVEQCKKYDVVIASRYLKESKNINWKLKRQIFSRTVSMYLRILLKIPIAEYTNGFRCYKREALKKVDFKKIRSKGFFVLTELAYLLHSNGSEFFEIPFTFTLRELNKSNLNIKELKEAFFSSLRLKLSSL